MIIVSVLVMLVCVVVVVVVDVYLKRYRMDLRCAKVDC